jgi:lipoate---protein ligase
MEWEILDTGSASAEAIMRKDAALLESLSSRCAPILHFYQWEGDSATYGHFVRPYDFLDLEKVKKRGLQLARRPTGGGIVFHAWDLAFSVLVPMSCPFFSMNTLENYALVNNAVLCAVRKFLKEKAELQLTPSDSFELDSDCRRFCMAKPTKYDVMLGARKIAGAAQRRQKGGFLHQGTIALTMPPEDYLRDVLLSGTRVLEAMQAHTFPLLGMAASQEELAQARCHLRELLKESFNKI